MDRSFDGGRNEKIEGKRNRRKGWLEAAQPATGGSTRVLAMLAGCAVCAWLRAALILPLRGTVAV
ncbi:hypothetical protein HKD28_10460 [Gluconobacter sp. LMG 1744]|uniref:hypothetical protein n=1 Tax=Gluconobacter cadivus TaxID=2728101 RepID=UPI00188595D8|nr:hypothetical protein [Gluconobacter cadivus]MBF0891825.1 hypothetical protein [Gluconobacter cadivus]